MAAGTLGAYYTGSKVVIVGLALLVASFGWIVLVALHFDIRMRAATTQVVSTTLNWRRYLMVLYCGSALILIRFIFRLIEYVQRQFWVAHPARVDILRLRLDSDVSSDSSVERVPPEVNQNRTGRWHRMSEDGVLAELALNLLSI
jgi:hypothetical protein